MGTKNVVPPKPGLCSLWGLVCQGLERGVHRHVPLLLEHTSKEEPLAAACRAGFQQAILSAQPRDYGQSLSVGRRSQLSSLLWRAPPSVFLTLFPEACGESRPPLRQKTAHM
jgi:hypothetical protein